MDYKDEGSYGAGFLLGLILGLAGLIIALCLDKAETKRGAIHGFVTSLVIGGVIGICVTCSSLSMIQGMF